MSYFRELPDLYYQSPLSTRTSSKEYVRIKNLFRRVKLRDDLQNVFTLFNKYEIGQGERPDTIAEDLYGSNDLDWVVMMSAGIINLHDQWPLSDYDLYRYAENKYGDDLNAIHHYETIEVVDSRGRLILPKGKVVDANFTIPPAYDAASGNYYVGVGAESNVKYELVDSPVVLDPEYNNGAITNVVGNGSDFFKREVTTNGVRIMGAGTVGGQTAVPDAWLEKVARMVELFTDVNGAGINETAQRNLIKTLSGDSGTYHAGKPTIQRVARGSGAAYTPNFLTDQGIIDWNLTNLYSATVQNDMVWYLNSSGVGYGDGDTDAQEVIEHVFHTLHMHGLPADTIKLYEFLTPDWASGPLYAAMEEAYDAGKWDSSGYGGNAWKTNAEAFEVAAKEYLYLLNFCMFEYTSLWPGGSLAPEWTDDMRTQAGIQANNPLGYAFHNTYIAPVISKPSLATIRSIFQDGNTPQQDNPALAGASGYVVSTAYIGNVSGDISPVIGISNYEYETRVNNDKRLIYILKPEYLQLYLNDMRRIMNYEKSSQYINKRLAATENTRNTSPQ
jgi:hypothetical protein